MQANNQNQPKEGFQETFYQNGNIQCRGYWKNGLKHGVEQQFFEETEKVWSRINYVNGKKHGLEEKFYQNRNIYTKTNYENGLKHGLYESFYENGNIQERTNYTNNKWHGLSERFYPRNTKKTKEYENSIKYYIGDQEVTTCPICLENLNVPRILGSCGHIFCEQCILYAYQEIYRCPCCRQEYDELDLQY